MINQIVKRDGTVVPFDKTKITRAIYKAMLSVKNGTMNDAEKIADKVVKELEKKKGTPTVEQIQDLVESTLMTTKINNQPFKNVAKTYILYREKRRTIREEKERLGVKDDLKLSINAVKVLEARYLLKDEEGKIIETPRQMFRRVAMHLGIVDSLYDYKSFQKTGNVRKDGKKLSYLSNTQIETLNRAFDSMVEDGDLTGSFEEFLDFVYTNYTTAEETINEFEEMMQNLEFVPNSPTMMNAGGRLGQLSACFVLPVGDIIEEIFDAVKYTAQIQKSGGGTGFAFSRRRAKDEIGG